jgi:uncharacterized membrane protein (UPF0127 family)
MELRRQCAYNQTRECFLGLEVSVANVSTAVLKNMFRKLSLKSGEGLWIIPFRGMPDTDMRAPLDLIYLDNNCRVIEVVESFPTFRVSPSSPKASSVLALPIHSIYSSQTQAGDQLVLCVAEEMQGLLERISSVGGVAGGVQGAVLLRGKQLWSDGPGVAEVETSSGKERSRSGILSEIDIFEPEIQYVKPSEYWWKRLWFSGPKSAIDKRFIPREVLPGLDAFYWTGDAPKAHRIKDISPSGLYLITEERWYPGTLILMTLQAAGDMDGSVERSIAVHSRAVRWGNDGVGMQFIPQDAQMANNGLNPLINGASTWDIEQFLERLRKGKERR